MTTNAAFVIGTRHACVAQPCQDYARAGENWVAVSDGCSQGGNTDLGARAWVLAAQRVVRHDGLTAITNPLEFMNRVLEEGRALTDELPFDDCFATIGVGAFVDDHFHAFLQGDGCIAVALANGGIEYWDIESPKNAPLYPQYLLQPELIKAWDAMVEGACARAKRFQYDADGTLLNMSVEDLDTQTFFNKVWSKDDVYAMLVCTDGVFTVPHKKDFDMLNDLFSVKDPTGAFIQRRIAAMQRAWIRNNETYNADDLAVGAVWLPTP